MKPKEVARLYLVRHNAHDVEGVMALFDEEARFEIPGRLMRCGKEEIRQTEEWEAAVHDHLRAVGVDELRYTSMTFEVRDGRITCVTAALAPDSYNAMQRAH